MFRKHIFSRFHSSHSEPSLSPKQLHKAIHTKKRKMRLELFQSIAWLPSHSGILRICDAWLPEASMSMPSMPSMLQDFTFATAVCKLAKSWSILEFQSSPSLKNIVDILRRHCTETKQIKQKAFFSVFDWRCLYAHLAVALQPIQPEGEDWDFLHSEAWLFVPDHPQLISGHRDAFDLKGEGVQRHGTFCSLGQVVFRDECRLIDTYSKSVSDAASDFARASCGKRIIGQYYWGPHTLFPPNWTSERYSAQHAAVQDLFRKLGVSQCLEWCATESALLCELLSCLDHLNP